MYEKGVIKSGSKMKTDYKDFLDKKPKIAWMALDNT